MADNNRAIKDVKILDIEKRRVPTKHYIYVIEISWDDGTQHCLYRKYSHFFSFQTTLLETFPVEGGVKNPADRIIPFLPPGKVYFGRNETRELALKRKHAIDGYCQNLIKLPQHISQSEHVLTFFELRDEDISNMKQDYSKSKVEPRTRKTSNAEVISGPVLLEQYVALADYKKLGRGQISLITGDVIEVIEKNDNGWWFVSVEDEQGWVPCSYVQPAEGSKEDPYVEKCNEEKYFCVKKYEAVIDDEINLDLGSIVQVLQKSSDGWWQVRYKGNVGWAPRAFLKPAPTGDDGIESTKAKSAPKTRYRKLSEAAAPPPRRRTVRKKMQDLPQTTNPRQQSSAEDHACDIISVVTSDYLSTVGDTDVNISEGSSVEVIEKAPNGWWYIKFGNDKIWVPASIMERRRKGDDENFKTIISAQGFQNKQNLETVTEIDENVMDPDSRNVQNKESAAKRKKGAIALPAFTHPTEQAAKPKDTYTAIKSYTDDDEGILSFEKGDTVHVLEKDDGGWWLAKIGNNTGWVPSNFLQQDD